MLILAGTCCGEPAARARPARRRPGMHRPARGGGRGCEGCGRGRGLIDASSVAVARDGKSAYVAGSGSSAVAAFARDQATTAHAAELRLRERDQRGRRNQGDCADGNALSGATAVEISPDGRFVYAAAYDAGGIAIFERNQATGALRQVGCVRPVRTCTSARAMSGASAIALSPDGKTPTWPPTSQTPSSCSRAT